MDPVKPGTSKPKVSYVSGLRNDWKNEFPWLIKKEGTKICKACNICIVGGSAHFRRHDSSESHRKNMQGVLKLKNGFNNILERSIAKAAKREGNSKLTQEIAVKITNGEYNLRKKYSYTKAWTIFAKITEPNGKEVNGFVYCQMCKKVLRYNITSHSNLLKHTCYIKKFLANNKEENIKPIKIKEVKNIQYDNNILLQLITKWMINDCKPSGMMHDTGLKILFEECISLGSIFGTKFDILSHLPSSTDVKKDLSQKYEKCFEGVRNDVAEIKENGFSLTADIWNDDYTKQNYVAVHMYYAKNGVLTSSLLGNRALENEQFTAQNISNTISTILEDFDCKVSGKTLVVTKPNEEVLKTLPFVNKMPCISFLINNALQESVQEVAVVSKLVTDCIRLFNYLKESGLDAPFNNTMNVCVPHCWNTIYNVISFFENNWIEINKILEIRNENERIGDLNVQHIMAVGKFLQPFGEALRALEQDNKPTLHLVLIYINELRKVCTINESEFRDLEFIENLKENAQLQLTRIVAENLTIFHKIAIFLYPPTNKLLTFSSQQKKRIEEECRRLCMLIGPESLNTAKVEEPDTISAIKHQRLFADFVQPRNCLETNQLINCELVSYKNANVANSEDFDCLRWWHLSKYIFPHLYKLSCIILTTPASIAGMQKTFSVAGSYFSTAIHDLDSNEREVEKMTFSNINSKQYDIDSGQ